MMRTPDGQGIELDKFHTPNAIRFGPVAAPVNTLGIRRVMFAVDDINAVVARMRAHGAELIGEMQYGDTYRLEHFQLVLSTRPWYFWRPGGAHGRGVLDGFA